MILANTVENGLVLQGHLGLLRCHGLGDLLCCSRKLACHGDVELCGFYNYTR
jgi:hypothetical protein